MFKLDRRRLKVRYSEKMGVWNASYPYPGMETILGGRHSVGGFGKTAKQAEKDMLKTLNKVIKGK